MPVSCVLLHLTTRRSPSSKALGMLHKIEIYHVRHRGGRHFRSNINMFFCKCRARSPRSLHPQHSRFSSQPLSLAKRRYAQAAEVVVVKSVQACLAAERKAVQVNAKHLENCFACSSTQQHKYPWYSVSFRWHAHELDLRVCCQLRQ